MKRQINLFSNLSDCSNQEPQQPQPEDLLLYLLLFATFTAQQRNMVTGSGSFSTALSLSELGFASSTLPASAVRQQ